MRHVFRVWDGPTRFFHWSLAALCVLLMVTGEAGWLRVHMLTGPAVLALILFRVVWGVVGSTTSRFAFFVKGPTKIFAYIAVVKAGRRWPGVGHNPLGALSVLALLAVSAGMGLTGLFTSDDIETDGPLAPLVSSSMVKLVSGFHRLGGTAVLIVAGVHLAAILIYRFGKGEDLILPMITGMKTSEGENVPSLDFKSWRLAAMVYGISAAVVWGCIGYLTSLAE